MTRSKWTARIRAACEQAGTYKPFADDIIETLADMLARRDQYRALFKRSGGEALLMHINKAGAQNLEKNPALRMIDEINRDALAYWRDLGLTPAAWRRLNTGPAEPAAPADPLAKAIQAIKLVK